MKTKLALTALLLCSLCQAQELPNAPSVTWKQTFDWKFAAAHGSYLGAMLWDQHETLKGEASGCALESGDSGPYRATRGDLMKKNMPFFAGFLVADALIRKAGIKYAWLAAPAVGTIKHSQGAIHWIHLCK